MTRWSITRFVYTRLVIILGALWFIGCGISILAVTLKTNDLFDAEIQSIALTLAAISSPEGCRVDPLHVCRAESSVLSGERAEFLSYQIRKRDGSVLYRSLSAPSDPFPVDLEPGFARRGATQYYTAFLADGGAAVQVAASPEERLETLGWLIGAMLIPMLCLLGISWFVVDRTARRATEPIRDVVLSLHGRSGRFLNPIALQNVPDELVPVVQGINRMLGRLRSALDQERAFSANCAHELRNPLAAAAAQAELIAEDTRHESAGPLLAALRDLGHKLDRLLQLSRAEAGIAMSTSTTDLVATVEFLVDDYERVDPEGGRLDLEVLTGCHLTTLDRDALGIVIRNLFDNALKYSPDGSRVSVVVGAECSLRVVNSGPALSPDTMARITKRFERGTDVVAGEGLGLAIILEIVSQAGGTLELKSPASGDVEGFEAIVQLPCAKCAA